MVDDDDDDDDDDDGDDEKVVVHGSFSQCDYRPCSFLIQTFVHLPELESIFKASFHFPPSLSASQIQHWKNIRGLPGCAF